MKESDYILWYEPSDRFPNVLKCQWGEIVGFEGERVIVSERSRRPPRSVDRSQVATHASTLEELAAKREELRQNHHPGELQIEKQMKELLRR